jgi:hypothetical protein
MANILNHLSVKDIHYSYRSYMTRAEYDKAYGHYDHPEYEPSYVAFETQAEAEAHVANANDAARQEYSK